MCGHQYSGHMPEHQMLTHKVLTFGGDDDDTQFGAPSQTADQSLHHR